MARIRTAEVKLSLLVGCPEAVFSIRSKMRWPHCCTVSSPSRMVPQLTFHVVFHALEHRRVGRKLDRGRGLAAEHAAAAGGKQTRLAPPATCRSRRPGRSPACP